MWDLIVSVPDHCLSFYFKATCKLFKYMLLISIFALVCLKLTYFKQMLTTVNVFTCLKAV